METIIMELFYKSFDEKHDFFEYDKEFKRIKTKDELDQLFERDWNIELPKKTFNSSNPLLNNVLNQKVDEQHNKPLHIVFRGSNEAKYKILSSLQIEWHKKHITNWGIPFKKDLINKIFELALQWDERFNHRILSTKYMDTYGTKDEQAMFPIFSIIQHYGGKTPLIDFSLDLYTALFFAFNNSHFVSTQDPDDINNYVSLYYIKLDDAEFMNIWKLPENGIDLLNRGLNGSENNRIKTLVDNEIRKIASQLPYFWKDDGSRPYYISDDINKVLPKDAIKNSPHIIKQLGLFVINLEENLSLEEAFKRMFEKNTSSNKKKIYALDIHKNLLPYLESKLLARDVTETTVYPGSDEKSKYKELAEYPFSQFLKMDFKSKF